MHEVKKGEMIPQKGAKQPKHARDKRASSVESKEDSQSADVRRPPHTWSPKLEVDNAPILLNASVRSFQGGHAGYLAEAFEQSLLLPRDMEAYRGFKELELFLSLKRDLAMASTSSHVFFFFFFFTLHYIYK